MIIQERRECIWKFMVLSIFMILVFLINCRYINMRYTPYLIPDEYGYIVNAAYFSGNNWYQSISDYPYYSFGYSLLIAPILKCIKNPIMAYRGIIIINCILAALSFLLIYKVSKKLFSNMKESILIFISFSISMYPALSSYTQFALSETLLIFLVWLILWVIIKIRETKSIALIVLASVLSAYLFFVHQRMLGIITCILLLMLIEGLSNKNFKRQLIVFIFTFTICFFGLYLIKKIIVKDVWIVSTSLAVNDFGGILQKLKYIFSIEGIFKLLKVLLGHIFYIGVSTYLIGYLGILAIVKNIYGYVKNKKENNNNNIYIEAYVLFCFIFTLMISVIFMCEGQRIDQIMYGRYVEPALMPIIVFGMYELLKKNSVKKLFIVISFFIITAFVTNFEIQTRTAGNYIHSLGIARFIDDLNIGYIVIFTVLTFLLINICINIFSVKWKNYIVISVLAVLFFTTGNQYIIRYVNNSVGIQYKAVADYINQDKRATIYFLKSDDWDRNTRRAYIQYLAPNKQIIVINQSELESLEGEHLLLVNVEDKDNELLRERYNELNSIKDISIFTLDSLQK